MCRWRAIFLKDTEPWFSLPKKQLPLAVSLYHSCYNSSLTSAWPLLGHDGLKREEYLTGLHIHPGTYHSPKHHTKLFPLCHGLSTQRISDVNTTHQFCHLLFPSCPGAFWGVQVGACISFFTFPTELLTFVDLPHKIAEIHSWLHLDTLLLLSVIDKYLWKTSKMLGCFFSSIFFLFSPSSHVLQACS
jgi:hypothetical protein